MKSIVGRIVIYRARTRGYHLPAIATAAQDMLDTIGLELGDAPPHSPTTRPRISTS
ncbi:hypothetical protein [Streptomyces sp. MNP-20]|uniref:hypothetical protein n=1 Tax=Streptomyces sp. MNP-20 TaxID=2721165 RepID=UPI0015577DDA|nr:hypothetical protein [Streptomyces sp. MNP-20]